MENRPRRPSRNVRDFNNSESLEFKVKEAIVARDEDVQSMHHISVMPPPICVYGQSGGGKTTACINVLYDHDIEDRFADGILYKQLKINTRERDVINAWAEMVRIVAGTKAAESIRKLEHIADAQEATRAHFRKRRTVICIDNVWRVNKRDAWIKRFVHIAGGTSTIVLTTRERVIPIELGCETERHLISDVGKWNGPRAEAIFDQWLGLSPEQKSDSSLVNVAARQQILKRCDGLPLALSVAASAVYFSKFDWNIALQNLDNYLHVFKGTSDKTVYSAIGLSVNALGREPADLKHKKRFLQLGAVQRNSLIPLRALALLWVVDDAEALQTVYALDNLALIFVVRSGSDMAIRGVKMNAAVHQWLITSSVEWQDSLQRRMNLLRNSDEGETEKEAPFLRSLLQDWSTL